MDELNIEKFDPTVADLQQLVEITSQVVVTDINDKAQIEAVKTNRIALRDARVSITKKGKELRDGAVKFQKAVIAKEKELVAIIEPEENRLKEIEEEVKAKKIRAERLAILPQRKERLNAIGDGRDYSDKDEVLLGMDDTEFEAYVNEKVAAKNEADAAAIKAREDAAVAEEKRLADEKTAREREERARQEERERIEREQREAEERAAQEAQREADRKAAEEKALAAEKRYQDFLAENGYTEETKGEFYIDRSDSTKVVLYKKVGVFVK